MENSGDSWLAKWLASGTVLMTPLSKLFFLCCCSQKPDFNKEGQKQSFCSYSSLNSKDT